MKNKPKILVMVPDGVGIKNYLYTNVFKDRDAQIELLHDFNPKTEVLIREHLSVNNSIKLPDLKEGLWEKFYRELVHLSRLKYNARQLKNPTILRNWNPKTYSLPVKLFYKLIELRSGFVSGSYKRILARDQKFDRSIRKNQMYKELLTMLGEIKPDVIFCTHQRALKAPYVFAAAKDLGIKTVSVIYSWDNLPKARLALKADQYFVWSEYMKKELFELYPELSEQQVKVTGTPQFECYSDKEHIIPKSTFYERYGLDPNKNLICFSGDDQYTSPEDPDYLYDFATVLTNQGLAEKYTILFRRCPVDVSGRYNWVLEQFPDLIKECSPIWTSLDDHWSSVFPLFDDVSLLVSTAYYCDLVVNLGSTMAFDFGMFEKPCIYINYDQPKGKIWSVQTIYAFEHFKSMPDRSAVAWWDGPETLPGILSELEAGSTNIKDWIDVVVEDPQASDRIYQHLIND